MRKSQDALRVCLQSCQVIEIQVPYLKYVIKPMTCNLYFVFYSVSKCISWLKHIFQRNLFDHDDPVPPPHLQFFSPRISAIPMTRPDWGWGACPMPPHRGYATVRARTYSVASCSQNSVVSEIHGLKHSGGVMNGSYSLYCSKYDMQLHRHSTTNSHPIVAVCLITGTYVSQTIALVYQKTALDRGPRSNRPRYHLANPRA